MNKLLFEAQLDLHEACLWTLKKKDLFWEGRKEKEKERSIYIFSKSFLELDEATKVLG